MQRLLLPMLVLPLALAGCGKKAEKAPPAQPAPPLMPPSAATRQPAPTTDAQGFVVTESGLKYKDKKVGSGSTAVSGSRVTVHYKGWLDNGKVFDSSRKPGGRPFDLTLGAGQVIKGWDEGLRGMKPGGVRELIIPPKLAYGDEEGGTIPANSTLHFEVEMLKVSP